MSLKKRVRIIKKIQQDGNWKFVSLKRAGNRFIWDDRPGVYYLEWWEGKRRCREAVGPTPSGALTAQRRKQNELLGAQFSRVTGGQASSKGVAGRDPADGGTPFTEAKRLFLAHVEAHSPDKPETVRRYRQVIEHFERHLAHGKYVEAITRADIDEYKIARCGEKSEQHDRQITASTVNFEVGTLRTFFYYLTNERGLQMENPCKKFKHLRDAKKKAGRRHPTYSQAESDAILAQCDPFEYAVFATLLLTGLRKRELYFLTWRDVDLRPASLSVSGEGKVGFSPKDYEERTIPLPPDLVRVLSRLPRRAIWVFPNRNGNRLNHLLRRLEKIARRANVKGATLHKFRHTYGTRLVEKGTNIVTVQRLMGHSDIKTTLKYLNPEDALKRQAANRLSLPPMAPRATAPKKGPEREQSRVGAGERSRAR